jgi:hypothetical protein
MAQGQRAGLITLRSLDRDELPVSFQFAEFTEFGRHRETLNASSNKNHSHGGQQTSSNYLIDIRVRFV